MKASISTKAMLIYGGVFLLVIALTFWLSYVGTVGKLESDLRNTNLALLKQVDEKIEVAFRQSEKDLLTLTEELEFVYFMLDSYLEDSQRYENFYALSTKLKKFITTNPQFASIFVYSSVSGDILTDKAYFKDDDALADNWLDDYENMPEYVKWLTTHEVWDGTENQDVVTLVRSYPTLSSPGYRKGMVAVNIKEDVLYDMIKEVFQDNKVGHLFIIDKEGNVVTHDDKTQIYRNLKEVPYIRTALSKTGSGYFAGEVDGIRQSVFYHDSVYTGWRLISIMPESQIYKPVQVTRNLLMAFAAGMVALALLALFYVNRWTFKPLDRLVGKMSGSFRAGIPQGRPGSGLSYLEKVFDQLVQDRSNLEQHMRDSKPVLKWRMMMDMLAGYRTDYPSVRHHLESVGIRLFPERFLVCTAEIGKEGVDFQARDETLYTYAFCNVAEELINSENAGVAIDLGQGRAAVLFSFAEGDAEQNHLRALAILEQLLDVMRGQFGLVVTVGVGRCCKEMKDIPKSYDESQKALQYKMVFGRHSVISIEDLQPLDSQDYYRLTRMADRVADALKQADAAKMKACVEETLKEAADSNLPPELIRQLAFDLVMKPAQAASSLGVEIGASAGRLNGVYERINRSGSLANVSGIVVSYLESLAGQVEERRSQKGKNAAVERMLRYIGEHFQESDLSLDRLAHEFQLSPTYISKQFKEHTGSNFIDYLIEIRIREAQRLLSGKDMKVNEIAEAVGYMNARSFLRTFKKYAGMTPMEYRDWSARTQTAAGQGEEP
ncbi:helix-turn-helix domain-containing protein [Cohnella massiliensis]|uniref:helix-turn-helix domain-containing protein n=1 Tax=Cohnella massiliensis TaxID=1816691 RepID=UPI0009BA340F|nr:helix-turn-helix domain-containing protein [Cohnella massiliensis]